MEGTVLAEFGIDGSGMPYDIRVVKSSGHSLLDKEAVKSIKKASPYPHLKERIEVPIRFMLTD